MPATAITPTAQAQSDLDQLRRKHLLSAPDYSANAAVYRQTFGDTPAAVQAPAVAAVGTSTAQQAWANKLAKVGEYNDIANQGTAGMVATKKQQKADADFKRWQEQVKSMQEKQARDFAAWQKSMEGRYPVPALTTRTIPGGTVTTPGQNGMVQHGISGPTAAGQYNFADQTDQQIATWARQAGWREQDIPQLIAIAQGESSRSPTAINDKNANGSVDYGLVQINTIHRGDAIMNDPRIGGASSFYEGGGWKDPVKNLIVAKSIHDAAGGWGDWVAFTSGAATYKPAYTVATQAQVTGAQRMVGGQPVSTSTGLRSGIVMKTMQYVGKTPYVFAGNDLNSGVDCSGLVHEIYEAFGLSSVRTAEEFAHPERWGSEEYGGNTKVMGNRVGNINQLQPGDLIAYQGGWRGPNFAGHVVIYAGNGEILEAAEPGTDVRRRPLRQSEFDRGNMIYVHVNLPGDR